MPASTRLMAQAALLIPPLLWAGNFIVGRAVRDDVMPMALSFGRWSVALICLLPFAYSAMRRDWRRYWQYRWLVLGTSITGIAACNTVIYFALRTATASNALLLHSLAPILIMLLGAVFYRQRMSWAQGFGIGLSFFGVLTLVLQGSWANWQSITFVPGDLVMLCASLLWAVYTLWLRQLPADLDRLGLMCVQVILALLVLLPLTLVEHSYMPGPALGIEAWVAIVYVGIFASVLAFIFYMRAVQHFGPARAGLCVHLAPVFGVVLSAVFLNESLYAYHALGIAAIVSGLICSGIGDDKHKTPIMKPLQ